MTTQDLYVVSLFRTCTGTPVDAATFPGRVSTEVASPTSEGGGSGGWVASVQATSGPVLNPHGCFITQVQHHFSLPDTSGVPDTVTIKLGGWVITQVTSGAALTQQGHLVRVDDGEPDTHWFTPTELGAGDLLFTADTPSPSLVLSRFDIEYTASRDAVSRVVLAGDACLTGEGYATLDWTFWRVNGSDTVSINEFEYAYAEYAEPGWPLRVVDAGGPAYRIGPDYNPDGGLLRIVDPATRRVWEQGGTAPMRLVGPPGEVFTTLPMTGWVYPPPVAVTEDMLLWSVDSFGDFAGDFSDSTAQAWAGSFNVVAPGSGIGYGMSIEADVGPSARVAEGFLGVRYSDVLAAGLAAWSPPGGAETDLDDPGVVLSTQVVGRLYAQATDASANPTSIRQITEPYDPITGPDFHTSSMVGAATVVVPTMAGVDSTPEDVTFDVSWDTVGDDRMAVYLPSLDAYAPSGATWDPDIHRFTQFVSTVSVAEPAKWVATVRPPRYRLTTTPAEWISDGSNNWYWDAGEYLHSDFTVLDGYPTALPTGINWLDFWVLPPGVSITDSFTTDFAIGEIYDSGGGVAANYYDDDGTYVPGSHLWIYWDAPGTDDPPPPDPPNTYVPAFLAANGTA